MYLFSFPDDNLSKYQWIFIKLGMCIDVEILFGIANGQITSMFDIVSCPPHDDGRVLLFCIFTCHLDSFLHFIIHFADEQKGLLSKGSCKQEGGCDIYMYITCLIFTSILNIYLPFVRRTPPHPK